MYSTHTLLVIPALAIALTCSACASTPAPTPAATSNGWGLQSAKVPTLAQLRGEPERRSSAASKTPQRDTSAPIDTYQAPAPAPDATPASIAGSPLNRDQIEEGFVNIRRSVDQCLARSLKRDGQAPAEAVELRVLIAKTGTVARININHDLRRSPFEACLKSHRDRWRFPRFSGSPLRVAKTFRLQ